MKKSTIIPDQWEISTKKHRIVFSLIRDRAHSTVIIKHRLKIWGRVFGKQRWAVLFAIEIIIFRRGFTFYFV
jgi:hypothetical protein